MVFCHWAYPVLHVPDLRAASCSPQHLIAKQRYSWAPIFSQLLTGKPCFTGKPRSPFPPSLSRMLEDHADRPILEPGERTLAPGFRRFVARCLGDGWMGSAWPPRAWTGLGGWRSSAKPPSWPARGPSKAGTGAVLTTEQLARPRPTSASCPVPGPGPPGRRSSMRGCGSEGWGLKGRNHKETEGPQNASSLLCPQQRNTGSSLCKLPGPVPLQTSCDASGFWEHLSLDLRVRLALTPWDGPRGREPPRQRQSGL